MFVNSELEKEIVVGDGISRKILGRGGSLMMVEVTFSKKVSGAVHNHPHEQVSYIAGGSFEFNLDGDKRIVKKGDSIYISSDKPHGVTALEENSIILDIFTPQRADFL